MRRLRASWLVAGFGAVACSNYTSSIKPDAPLHAASAYLYGRLYMETKGGVLGGGTNAMGFEIRCENGATYTLGSLDTREVQVLEISPSRCWLARAIFDFANGFRGSVKADPKTERWLDFTAGRAHYLGDYFAKGTFTVTREQFLLIHRQWEWLMNPMAGDRYVSTTAEMKRAFPNLASLPTDDLRLIPKEEPKRGNGIGPAPGEPPLSPAMLASLAPFIRRTYATLEGCEGECATGRCLPYRGRSGPEVACVIRCERNADCPEDLACSCPNRETPEAECLAKTPKDPYPRLCVPPRTPRPAPGP